MFMKLYHYSKEKYSILKTKSLVNGEQKGELISYNNHISFFFEPVPLDIVGKIFGPTHNVWAPGNRLYEHIVETRSLKKFFYKLVESPEKTELRYNDSISVEEYHKRLAIINKELNYEGTTIAELEKACTRLKGTTRSYFKLLPERRDFEEIRDKYAATVPHLMIYLEDRQLTPISIKEVVVKGEKEKLTFRRETRSYTEWL